MQREPAASPLSGSAQVRAGLMDEKVHKPSKHHTDEKIAENQKFVVSMTGQAPTSVLG